MTLVEPWRAPKISRIAARSVAIIIASAGSLFRVNDQANHDPGRKRSLLRCSCRISRDWHPSQTALTISTSPLDNEIEALLGGTWSGEVLQRMKEHHDAREAERRAREALEDPANVQKQRDEKRRMKQEQHEKRLTLKKERDRLWREKLGKTD
jgi:hypothetical protein